MPLPSWPDTSPGAAGAGGGPVDPTGSAGASFLDSCNLVAEIHYPAKTEDEEGGSTFEWLVVTDNFPCYIDKVRAPSDVVVGGAVRTASVYEVLFPLDATDYLVLPNEPEYFPNGEADNPIVRGQRRVFINGVGMFEIVNTDYGLSEASCLRAWCVLLGPAIMGDPAGFA